MKRPPQKVLVTGVAGFIGSHLAERLLSQGVTVIGLDNFDTLYDRSIKERNLSLVKAAAKRAGSDFFFLEVDITRPLDAAKLPLRDLETVFHLAALAGVTESLDRGRDYILTNVLGTFQILDLAKNIGCHQLVIASSSSVYGEGAPTPFKEDSLGKLTLSPYSSTKRAAEVICTTYSRLWDLKIANLRLFTVFGPRQRPDLAIHKFVRAISQGNPIEIFGGAQSARDYTYISDAVRGFELAADWLKRQDRPICEAFNIGGGRVTTLIELVSQIEQIFGTKAEVIPGTHRSFDMKVTSADLSKSKSVIGYSPQVTFSDGLKNFYEWFLEGKELKKKAA